MVCFQEAQHVIHVVAVEALHNEVHMHSRHDAEGVQTEVSEGAEITTYTHLQRSMDGRPCAIVRAVDMNINKRQRCDCMYPQHPALLICHKRKCDSIRICSRVMSAAAHGIRHVHGVQYPLGTPQSTW